MKHKESGAISSLALLLTILIALSTASTGLADTAGGARSEPFQEGMAGNPGILSTAPAINQASYKGDVIYQIVTDRFYDGDPSNNDPIESPGLYDPSRNNWKLYWGGDWAGIELKIPYLTNLGVTALWISPPVDNINTAASYGGEDNAGYHGYWARDFKMPEEHFGGWTDFVSLVAAARNAGIKVIIDWAPNHTSPIYKGENGALYDKGAFMADYSGGPQRFYNHNGSVSNWDDPYEIVYRNLWDLADLNLVAPEMDAYMKEAIATWLDRGVNGIRMDTVKHLSYGWQRSYADHILGIEDIFIFGEWYMSGPYDPHYYDNVRFANDSGISVLDFYLNSVIRNVFGYGSGSMYDLNSAMAQTEEDYYYPENMVTFIDNHDMDRFLSINPDTSDLNLALTFLMTVRGTPSIYYGTEQYVEGAGDPYNRPMMPSWNTNSTAFRLIGALSRLKGDQPALQFGDHRERWLSNDIYIYEREFNPRGRSRGDAVLVAMNKGQAGQYITGLYTALPAGTYEDVLGGLLGGENLVVSRGALENNPVSPFSLDPGEAAVWSYKRPSESVMANAVVVADELLYPTTVAVDELEGDVLPMPDRMPEIGSVAPVLTRPGNQVTIDGRWLGGSDSLTTRVIFCDAVGDQYDAILLPSSSEGLVAEVPVMPAGVARVKVIVGYIYSNGYDIMVLNDDQVPLMFTVENAYTNWGEKVYLTGSIYELSNWSTETMPGTTDPVSGGALGPAVTNSSGWMPGQYPDWVLDVCLPCDTYVEFKFMKVDPSGLVTTEGGSNHTYTTPACSTQTPESVRVTWQD